MKTLLPLLTENWVTAPNLIYNPLHCSVEGVVDESRRLRSVSTLALFVFSTEDVWGWGSDATSASSTVLW